MFIALESFFLRSSQAARLLTTLRAQGSIILLHGPLFKDRRKFPKMADPLLQGQYPIRGLYQALAVAAMCLLEQSATRPLIGDIVTALTHLASQTYDLMHLSHRVIESVHLLHGTGTSGGTRLMELTTYMIQATRVPPPLVKTSLTIGREILQGLVVQTYKGLKPEVDPAGNWVWMTWTAQVLKKTTLSVVAELEKRQATETWTVNRAVAEARVWGDYSRDRKRANAMDSVALGSQDYFASKKQTVHDRAMTELVTLA